MSERDEDRIRRAAAGDRRALSALLKDHVRPLRRSLTRRIPARWQSVLSEDDVIQQTFADAFQTIHRFKLGGDGSFAGWLTTLARRNLADALRMLNTEKRGGRLRRRELGDGKDSIGQLIETLSSSGTSPTQHLARAEVHERIERAISQLPQDYRAVVEMFDLAGDSVEAVARKLNLSRGAVYMLRARAHDWLKALVGAERDFFTDTSSTTGDCARLSPNGIESSAWNDG